MALPLCELINDHSSKIINPFNEKSESLEKTGAGFGDDITQVAIKFMYSEFYPGSYDVNIASYIF